MNLKTPVTKNPVQIADDVLVVRVQEGNKEAMGQLFLRHANTVRQLLTSIMGPNNELDDAVQEVFINAHRSIGRFRGNSRFSTWLHRITVNTALSALRRPRRPLPIANVEALTVDTPDAEGAVLARERIRRLYAIMDTLSPKRRVALTLFELEGLPIAEVAKATGVAAAVAKSRIFFARKELFRKAAEDRYLAPLLAELRR